MEKGNPTGETERERYFYNKGKEEGIKHAEPSPKTIKKLDQMSEEFTNLKIQMAEQKTDIKYIKEKLDSHISKEDELKSEVVKLLQEHVERIDKKVSSMDSRFSGKWVEKAFRWFLYAIALLFIGGLGKLFWELIKIVK